MGLKIAIGGDHAGYDLKSAIIKKLESDGHVIKDFGPFSGEAVDYPDYIHPLAEAVLSDEFDFGVAICGSGHGVNMVANKHAGIRAALCWRPELAALARTHNDANILCLPARWISQEDAEGAVDAFLSQQFEGGRHKRRVDKINC
jgi:ribose 5-phosphate isomerase B